jgi:cell shape-determining protein MreC
MLSWIFQITLISIILISLVHHLINFLKSTLTVPKIKDLVNTPTQKYENIYNIINNKNNNLNNNLNNLNNINNDYTLIDLLPSYQMQQNENQEVTIMKNELKNFLKSQLNK